MIKRYLIIKLLAVNLVVVGFAVVAIGVSAVNWGKIGQIAASWVVSPVLGGLIAFLLTLAILYFSEIIPKTLGATFWKQLALPSAYVIRVMVKLLYPFVWLSARMTSLFSGHGSGAISRRARTA